VSPDVKKTDGKIARMLERAKHRDIKKAQGRRKLTMRGARGRFPTSGV